MCIFAYFAANRRNLIWRMSRRKKNEKYKHKTWMKEQGGTRANKFHVFDNHRLLEQHKINDVVQILQVRRIILA